MSLSTAFNIISSSFAANAAQIAVVSNNIANVNTAGYSREVANLVTNPYGGADVVSVDAHRQCGARRTGLDLDGAGRDATGDRQWARDARRHRGRQLFDVVDFGRGRERRLAVSDARQPRKRSDDLRRLADVFFGRGRRGDRRPEPRPVAQCRRRGGQRGSRTGGPGHGLVGLDHQFAARPVPDRQRRGGERARRRAQTSQPPRTRAIPSSPSSHSRSA